MLWFPIMVRIVVYPGNNTLNLNGGSKISMLNLANIASILKANLYSFQIICKGPSLLPHVQVTNGLFICSIVLLMEPPLFFS